MNNCNRLLPACYRLGQGAMIAPFRTIFSRRAMIPWNLMERQMTDFDREFARLEREMNSAFRELGFPFPRVRTFFEPSSPSITSPCSKMFPTIEAETSPSTEAGKPGKYSIKVEVGEGFNPEDIKINLKDRQLTINAKLEQKSQDGTSRLYQEVSRSFTLPEGINPEEVKSLLTPGGVLTIEAPLPEVAELPQPKEIPITVEEAKS